VYEDIAAEVEALQARHGDERDLVWLDASRIVGAARTSTGTVELFVRGDEIQAAYPRVDAALRYGRWLSGKSEIIQANRLELPSGQHFDRVAAFLVSELLRNRTPEDAAAGFARTEPVIELALQQMALEEEWLVGLAGELTLLHALVHRVAVEQAPVIVGAWAGPERSARDLQVGSVGVEIKTTVSKTPRHRIQGLHQLETGAAVGRVVETDLYLASLRLSWMSEQDGSDYFSVASLVDEICQRLELGGAGTDDFLSKVEAYGPGEMAYRHQGMRGHKRFTRPFYCSHTCLYDVLDLNLKVLRRAALADNVHVDLDSLTFTVDLPETVTRPHNPVLGLDAAARRILQKAGLGGHDDR